MEYGNDIPRRSGRPLSFDRQKALHQAMLAFWRHGYETTSIADLTAAMGVTAPSLYAAFGDKKRLFLEAIRLYRGSPDDMQRALDLAPTAKEGARAMMISAAVAFTGETTPRGCLLASATASGSQGAADVQRVLVDIRQDIMARLQGRIARDVATGLLPPSTPAASVAGMVIALIQGMSVLARDGVGRDTLLAMADCALQAWPAPLNGE